MNLVEIFLNLIFDDDEMKNILINLSMFVRRSHIVEVTLTLSLVRDDLSSEFKIQ